MQFYRGVNYEKQLGLCFGLNSVFLKIYVKVLTPRTLECDCV